MRRGHDEDYNCDELSVVKRSTRPVALCERESHISHLFYLSFNTEQEVHFVLAFCYLFRELERRDRIGETREGSGRIASKTGDNELSNKTCKSFCSLVKEEVGLKESVALRFDPR